ncbi:hypothetical protein ACFX2B_019110 [Malus domestica]
MVATIFVRKHPLAQAPGQNPGPPKWTTPPSRRLKLNFDGAWRGENLLGGVGIIVRDDTGIFHGGCLPEFSKCVIPSPCARKPWQLGSLWFHLSRLLVLLEKGPQRAFCR